MLRQGPWLLFYGRRKPLKVWSSAGFDLLAFLKDLEVLVAGGPVGRAARNLNQWVGEKFCLSLASTGNGLPYKVLGSESVFGR